MDGEAKSQVWPGAFWVVIFWLNVLSASHLYEVAVFIRVYVIQSQRETEQSTTTQIYDNDTPYEVGHGYKARQPFLILDLTQKKNKKPRLASENCGCALVLPAGGV